MNRYNMLHQVGKGTFGEVTKAIQISTGEVVAVKRMRQRFASWEECLQLREIISLRRLQHPCIIKLKEVVRENTELFLIFEYMDQNIYQIMRQRNEQYGTACTFNEKEIRSIMAQTLLGLLAIHKGGFMHRDLKPENLLTIGDIVKIADFGLAKEIRSRPPFTDYVSTRWYRAPEICLRSTCYNSPIDIWACGVIFAELFLNRPLFPGASDADQIFKFCSVLGAPTQMEWDEGHQLARRMNIRFPSISPTPLRALLANAPPAALDLIESMLRYNPGDRPTAAQCLAHPFFTGGSGAGGDVGSGFAGGGGAFGAGPSSALFQGIISGQPHNPFHIAAGVPAAAGPTTAMSTGGVPVPGQFGPPVSRSGSDPLPGGRYSPSTGTPTPSPAPFGSTGPAMVPAGRGPYVSTGGGPFGTSPTGVPSSAAGASWGAPSGVQPPGGAGGASSVGQPGGGVGGSGPVGAGGFGRPSYLGPAGGASPVFGGVGGTSGVGGAAPVAGAGFYGGTGAGLGAYPGATPGVGLGGGVHTAGGSGRPINSMFGGGGGEDDLQY